jgi:alanine dehydrogenase
MSYLEISSDKFYTCRQPPFNGDFLEILWLDQDDVKSLLDMPSALEAVEMAFAQHGRNKVQMPPKSYLYFTEHNGDLRTMPAFLEEEDVAGVKVVNVHPENRKVGLPTVMATVILNSTSTGAPLAMMDGTYLTDIRTGAAGGVAARYLARENSSVVGMVGAGNQARTQLEAISNVFELEQVYVFDLDTSRAEDFKEGMESFACCDITVVDSIQKACDADILVTTTPSRKSIIKAQWLPEGIHINAIGADARGKEELEPGILQKARVVVDDIAQATHSGEVNVPLSEGYIREKDIFAQLGRIVAGLHEGRESDAQITVFDSTGLAIQDIVTANLVYNKAKNKGIGSKAKLF